MSGDRYKILDQNALHFVTFTVVNWIDVFTRKTYKIEKVTEAIKTGITVNDLSENNISK